MRQISRGDVGVRRPRHAVRHHDQPLAHRVQHRPHQREQPVLPGDALVHTDKGLIRFAELVDRARDGETFGVYTHDATNPDAPAERLEITRPEAIMVTGFNEIVKLRFSNGMELRCTPNHRIFTTNRGYVEAEDLTGDDEVKVLTLPAPAVAADWRHRRVESPRSRSAGRGDKRSRDVHTSPRSGRPSSRTTSAGSSATAASPATWSSTVYGSDGGAGATSCPRIARSRREMNDGVGSDAVGAGERHGAAPPEPARRSRGSSRRSACRARRRPTKVVPEADVPGPAARSSPRSSEGLFDADGCVYDGENESLRRARLGVARAARRRAAAAVDVRHLQPDLRST